MRIAHNRLQINSTGNHNWRTHLFSNKHENDCLEYHTIAAAINKHHDDSLL